MAEYYCGKWNDHTIVVENHTDREKLIVDDEILVETKSGLRFGSALTAPISGTDGLYVYVMVESSGCSCIVGKPLETEYDKKTKTYTAEYGGHVIEAINKSKAVLLVDGQEVDRQEHLFDSFLILGSKADENGKRYMAVIDGLTNGIKVLCTVYGDAENIRLLPCKKQGGELIPTGESGDNEEALATGLMMGMIIG